MYEPEALDFNLCMTGVRSLTDNLFDYFFFRCCLESEEQWSLVQEFCACHSLQPSTSFLCVCAQEGKWLPLLCHAQLYDIPPQKV